MPAPDHSGPVPAATWRLAFGAALLLSIAGTGGAEDRGPRLELFYGPNETTQVTLASLSAELDGRPLPLEMPAPTSPATQPFYTGPLAPGKHRLVVSVTMVGDSAVFRYVKDYRFDMRGALDFASAEEGVVQATVKVTDRLRVDVEWYDRYALAFSAVRTVPPPSPTAQREAPVAPAAPAVAVAPIAACAMEPLHFKFTQSTLSPRARGSLDRFAACLAGSGSRVTLVGHCDRRGSAALNQRLGRERADSAARYLVAAGIAAGRIGVESRGALEPVCPEPSAACHARNRRVVASVAIPAR